MLGDKLRSVYEAADVTSPAKNLLEFARLARPLGLAVTVAAINCGSANNVFIEAVRGGISEREEEGRSALLMEPW
jgi:hypothetical protein